MIVTSVALSVVTFACCYAISFSRDFLSAPNYFLSRSINYPPASCLGAFGMSIALMLVPAVSFARFAFLESVCPGSKTNLIAACLSNAAALGGLLVVCFPLSEVESAHFVGATLFFGASLITAILQVRLDRLAALKSMGSKCRFALSVLLSACVATQLCLRAFTESFSELEAGSGIQIVLFCGILTLYVTYVDELKGVKMSVVVDCG